MKRATKLHFGDFGKSFSLAFVFITIIWGLVSYYSLGRVYVSWQILLGNLAVSATLSALYYRVRYHRVLEYDDRRFILHIGSRTVEGDWKDFCFTSLHHKGFGVFTVRLYRRNPDKKDYVEIPASDIGLDPAALRSTIMTRIASPR